MPRNFSSYLHNQPVKQIYFNRWINLWDNLINFLYFSFQSNLLIFSISLPKLNKIVLYKIERILNKNHHHQSVENFLKSPGKEKHRELSSFGGISAVTNCQRYVVHKTSQFLLDLRRDESSSGSARIYRGRYRADRSA